MPFSENTHVTYVDDSGNNVIGIVKDYKDGTYQIQVRSEMNSGNTHAVKESQVKELKVSDPDACPVAGS